MAQTTFNDYLAQRLGGSLAAPENTPPKAPATASTPLLPDTTMGFVTPVAGKSNHQEAQEAAALNPAPQAPGPTGPVAEDRSGSINMGLSGLNSLGSQRDTTLASIRDSLAMLMGDYNAERDTNEATTSAQSDTNEGNLQRRIQASLLGGAQGHRGLMGTLSSLGALNGSGITLANEAVQSDTNKNLSEADDTFNENRDSINTNIGRFRTADEKRRELAERAASAQNQEAENNKLVQEQKYYAGLSDDYQKQLDTGQAKHYSDLAASLFPQIAKSIVPPAMSQYVPETFNPSVLSKFGGGSGSGQVSTTAPAPGSSVPGLSFGQRDPRKDKTV